MNKIIIIIASVLIVFAIVVLAVLYFKKEPATNNNGQQVNFDVLQTATKNFMSKPETKNFSDVSLIHASDEFTIQYDKNNKSFQITLIGTDPNDLNRIRYAAEKMFLDKVISDEKKACSLNVLEVIPRTQYTNLKEYEFPLSFCEAE